MYRPYVVYTPIMEGNTTSGGVRVMWGLYGWLLSKGMVAYTNVALKDRDFIGIYPEIMHENPGGAEHIVRYILNEPGIMGGGTHKEPLGPGPTKFDKEDDLYYFSRVFGKAKDEDHHLFLPILSTNLFKPSGKKRTKKAVFVGKDYDLHQHPEDCVHIDRSVTDNQQSLADLFGECQVLYCYDRVTAMTEIARLCGCRVIMINNKFTKEKFSEYEPGMNGISWGEDEGIELDTDAFREHYMGMKQTFSEKLDRFIERSQSENY